jgi:NAD(P)H dehydrogenase (quinone)
MFAVTGASGQLGRLVIEGLLGQVPAGRIVGLARDPAKLGDLAARGVQVRAADYDRPETLVPALAGVERLLLVSSSEIGKRAAQHKAVIDAAKAAGVGLVAYTSIARADVSPIPLAEEHRLTEADLAASGLPHVILRNNWYNENFASTIAAAPGLGAVYGASGDGLVGAAPRADYAAAAVAVLTGEGHAGRVYELSGAGFSKPDLAAMIAAATGKAISHADIGVDAYAGALEQAGLPAPYARMLAVIDGQVAEGWLAPAGDDLARLLGRAPVPMSETVKAVLAG